MAQLDLFSGPTQLESMRARAQANWERKVAAAGVSAPIPPATERIGYHPGAYSRTPPSRRVAVFPTEAPLPAMDLPASKGYFHNPSPWALPRSSFMSAAEANVQAERAQIIKKLQAPQGNQLMLPLVDEAAIQAERNKNFMNIVARGNANLQSNAGALQVASAKPTKLANRIAMAGARANVGLAKMNMRAIGAGIGMANGLSKAVLGANLGHIGFAAGVTAAVGYGAMSMLGISGSQAAGAARQFHETMKAANRPAYGYSALGQSTQGLVFGLNSRRTA